MTYANGDYEECSFSGRSTDRDGCITRFNAASGGVMEITQATWVDGKMHGVVREETRHGWVVSRYRSVRGGALVAKPEAKMPHFHFLV